MKLKEYLESANVKTKIVDVFVWNERKYDYDDIFGYEANSPQEVLNAINNDDDYFCDKEYLDYNVHDVEILKDEDRFYIRIEIERGE